MHDVSSKTGLTDLINARLSAGQRALHLRAVRLCRRQSVCEALLVRVLREIDRQKLYRVLGLRSLFQYAVQELRLAEPTAYMLIAVARKSAEVPRLASAVESGEISVAKASRAVACLTRENAEEMIAFASASTCREIDREVARRRPQAARRTLVKPISEDMAEIRLAVSRELLEKIRRAQEIAGGASEAAALEAALDLYLERRDPVRKAERAMERAKAAECVPAAKQASADAQAPAATQARPARKLRPVRVPLKAREKHAAFARDGGRCTHVDLRGRRCPERKWLHLHHVRPVSWGGTNDPDNLVTLCSAHHELVHQQSFPIEGEVSWLRAPTVHYGA